VNDKVTLADPLISKLKNGFREPAHATISSESDCAVSKASHYFIVLANRAVHFREEVFGAFSAPVSRQRTGPLQ
jgi:hypothetical protein